MDTVENWKLKLKTEKHCNKIIFKCVNSTVGLIFNEKVAEKYSLWDSWTMHESTIHRKKSQKVMTGKKKKIWNANVRLGSTKCASQTHSKSASHVHITHPMSWCAHHTTLIIVYPAPCVHPPPLPPHSTQQTSQSSLKKISPITRACCQSENFTITIHITLKRQLII